MKKGMYFVEYYGKNPKLADKNDSFEVEVWHISEFA